MLYGYRILPEIGIIIQYLEGELRLKDMKTFIMSVRKDRNYQPHFNSLIDVRNSYMDLTEDEMLSYIKHIKLMKGFLKKRKLALLTSMPEHFVHVKLMEELAGDIPLKVQIFTTFKSAVIWLGKPEFDEQLFEQTVKGITTIIK